MKAKQEESCQWTEMQAMQAGEAKQERKISHRVHGEHRVCESGTGRKIGGKIKHGCTQIKRMGHGLKAAQE